MDVYEGIARNKKQIAATTGGMIGEANRQANRSKVSITIGIACGARFWNNFF